MCNYSNDEQGHPLKIDSHNYSESGVDVIIIFHN